MLHWLAGLTVVLTAADHWTTYLCLRGPVEGWRVSELNPLADWLFATFGLVSGPDDRQLGHAAGRRLPALDRLVPAHREGRVLRGPGRLDRLGRGQQPAGDPGPRPLAAGSGRDMRRRLLATLACVAFSGLSCSIFAPGRDALPPVSAGPPGAAGAARLARPRSPRSPPPCRRRPTGLTAREVEPLARTVVGEARRHALEPSLVMAVMHVESRYYNFAVSPVGAIGLMQMMPETGEELAAAPRHRLGGTRRPSSIPTTNVRLGVAYLRELSDRYGSLSTRARRLQLGPRPDRPPPARGHRDARRVPEPRAARPTPSARTFLAAHLARGDQRRDEVVERVHRRRARRRGSRSPAPRRPRARPSRRARSPRARSRA